VQQLGRNHNGYFGEQIDLPRVLRDCVAVAQAHRWTVETLLRLDGADLFAFIRPAADQTSAGRRVYISTGIHGDEPGGPSAMLRLLQDDAWPNTYSLWLCPCLNPRGFPLNRRESAQGHDLNRQYLHPSAPETLAHVAWLQRQPAFDLCLCLHEDWESHGFYLYELNPDGLPSLAEKMIKSVAQVCPIDQSELIEGRPAQNGIIRPSVDPRSRPQWPEAFYLLTHKTRISYTLEAPSDFPLPVRVASLVTAVRAALDPR
jgi:hypothetical protein